MGDWEGRSGVTRQRPPESRRGECGSGAWGLRSSVRGVVTGRLQVGPVRLGQGSISVELERGVFWNRDLKKSQGLFSI